jgi:hypothetical protein
MGKKDAEYKRTMIIGAGQACKMLLKEIRHARESQNPNFSVMFNPVCIIDDERSRVGTEIDNVMICGTTSEIEKFAVENFITGLTLYGDGGYTMYADRLVPGSGSWDNYVPGYGFGVFGEGSAEGFLTAIVQAE